MRSYKATDFAYKVLEKAPIQSVMPFPLHCNNNGEKVFSLLVPYMIAVMSWVGLARVSIWRVKATVWRETVGFKEIDAYFGIMASIWKSIQ